MTDEANEPCKMVMLRKKIKAFGIVLKKVNYYKYREVFIVIIVMMFLLIWAELAVGLFGTRFAGG